MKKYSAILLALLFVVAIGSSSCSKNCKGGGWYGDRNLGYLPAKEKPADSVSPFITEEIDTNCDISNP